MNIVDQTARVAWGLRCKRPKTFPFWGTKGFTLVELLISVTLLSIVSMSLFHSLSAALTAYEIAAQKEALLSRAHFAVNRMAQFVRAADAIALPAEGQAQATLQISERLMDHYNNSSHVFTAGGDGLPDADNDADGLINEDAIGPDPIEWVTFALDKSDSNNWKLTEQLPDYSTAGTSDTRTASVLCEHVTAFTCTRVSNNIAEIRLTLDDGGGAVSLTTRALARFVL